MKGIWGRSNAVIVGIVLVMGLMFGGAFSAGCAPKNNPNLSPSGKAAYTADQVVTRLASLNTAAQQAEKAGQLDRNTTRAIVKFCGDSARVLKEAPNGWYPAVSKAWDQLKKDVPAASLPQVQVYWSAVDIALAAFAP